MKVDDYLEFFYDHMEEVQEYPFASYCIRMG